MKPMIIKKQDRIDYLIGGICSFYSITPVQLRKYERNPDKVKKKAMAVKILREVADLRFMDVAIAMGHKSQSAVWQLYDRANDFYDTDKKFKSEWIELKKSLLV